MTDEEMAKKIMGNFHNYQNKDAIPEEPEDEETKTPGKTKAMSKNFSIYADLQKVYGKNGEDVFYTFLNKVYDSTEDEIYDVLPQYLEDWMQTGTIKPDAIAKGVNRFMKVIPDQVNDVPKLSTYFSGTLFKLLDLQAIEPTGIVWIESSTKKEGEEDDDDMVFVEEYYKIMANLLVQLYDKWKNWNKVVNYFNDKFGKSFDILYPKILEDNLFQDITGDIGEEYA